MTITQKWTVFERFVKLPALQRGTLLRRRLPAWLSPKPEIYARLERRTPLAEVVKDMPIEGVVLSCVPHPTTGVGHRFSEWNTGLIVAREADVPFLNSGLGEGWDNAFGLTGYFVETAAYLKRHSVSVIRLPFVEWHDRPTAATELAVMVRAVAGKTKNTVVMLADGQNLFRQHDSARELRALYERRPSCSVRSAPKERLRIAVHIRRGDVVHMKQQGRGNWQARFVDTSWFVSVLAAAVQGLGNRPYEIEIFSQGSPEDFTAFGTFETARLRLDADPMWTFHRMATADVLITSPSSFSFNAGLVNPGVKLARSPWWHEIPQGDGWFPVHEAAPDSESIRHFVGEELQLRERNNEYT